METCFECKLPIEGEVHEVYVVIEPVTPNNQWGEFGFRPLHIECMDNKDRPDENKVCETCGKTGKDSTGKYPGLFQYNKIQHPEHIDWDNVRKYGR